MQFGPGEKPLASISVILFPIPKDKSSLEKHYFEEVIVFQTAPRLEQNRALIPRE